MRHSHHMSKSLNPFPFLFFLPLSLSPPTLPFIHTHTLTESLCFIFVPFITCFDTYFLPLLSPSLISSYPLSHTLSHSLSLTPSRSLSCTEPFTPLTYVIYPRDRRRLGTRGTSNVSKETCIHQNRATKETYM